MEEKVKEKHEKKERQEKEKEPCFGREEMDL